MKRIALHIMMVFIFAAMPLLSKSGNAAAYLVTSHYGGGEDKWLKVDLSTGDAPSVGGTASLVVKMTPAMDAPNLEVQWIVPDGVELIGDASESKGAVAAAQSVSSHRKIRFPSAGTYRIIAEVSYSTGKSIQISGVGVLFFTIRSFGSSVSPIDPAAHNTNHSKMPYSSDQPVVAQDFNGPTSPGSTPCFSVHGTITRTDKIPYINTITNVRNYTDVIVPVRNAPVDIREQDTLFDDSYDVVYTDANGYYSTAFCDDDGLFDNTLEVYIRLRAELAVGGQEVVKVEDTSWIDEVYEFDSPVQSSGGGSLTFNMTLDYDQSGIFNIADAILDAWTFWNASGGDIDGDPKFGSEAEIHWEAGYGETRSYYYDVWKEITIADTTDPDQWDDTVIIHEWGHFADDKYGCDDASGGPHNFNQILGDSELSWSEGYADYWQSAVRSFRGDPQSEYYFDLIPFTATGSARNIETYDVDQPSLKSTFNELSVAAALWDLNDAVNDGQDTVSFGHKGVQGIFTSDEFQSVAYGFFDDTCDFDTYMRAWILVNPSDGPTAAVVKQNADYVLPPSGAPDSFGPAQPTGTMAQTSSGLSDSIWWHQVTYVADNSASMAAGSKFGAVKTGLTEAINDLGALPEGTEFSLFTFNNTSALPQAYFAGQFFPARLTPTVNNLSTSGAADAVCKVQALSALSQAVDKQSNGDAWLFTDGDTYTTAPTVETMVQRLNERQIRASIALMGICPTVPDAAAADDPSANPDTLATEEKTAQISMQGAARNLLGPAASSTPGGLVPYLLTASKSGGQFLYIDPAQLPNASDILRAQITHSAGAGRWSDYVSDTPTYTYDKLPSWEYSWIDAAAAGTYQGNPVGNGYLTLSIPGGFSFYDQRPLTALYVNEDGYMVLGPHTASVTGATNTTLPTAALPNNAMYAYWDSLLPLNIICDPEQSGHQPSCGITGAIYTHSVGNWFVVEYNQYDSISPTQVTNTFEVLLNNVTGEIRYQYKTVPNGGASATIGMENATGSSAVQVSYNDIAGASNGMGYKFIPASAQPTKTYTVAVDSLMSGVGFLLTGYSGDFQPLVVKKPDGSTVSCASVGVLCLNLGLVQYVQVDVNGKVGNWQAIVDAGPSGSGTFSFSSMAAGQLSPWNPGDHTLSTLGSQFLVNMGKAVDGNQITGRFHQPNNLALGDAFLLYDDGAHNDGVAGDGRFGSAAGVNPGQGTGYLDVTGMLGGVAFRRTESVPYTFSPISVRAVEKQAANLGGATALHYELKNLDSVAHCYNYTTQLPTGWWLNGLGSGSICLTAGQTLNATYYLYLAAGTTNSLPVGTTGEVVIGLVEQEKGLLSDTDSVQVLRTGAVATIAITNLTQHVAPNGGTAELEVWVYDSTGAVVADGTTVSMSVLPAGNVVPATGITKGGTFNVIYTSGASLGTMTVKAQSNGVIATAPIDVSTPGPNQLTMEVSPRQMAADGNATATITATVRDRWGNPMANQSVRVGVEGDGQGPLFNGVEVASALTNGSGQVVFILNGGQIRGKYPVRAELMVNDQPVKTAREVIWVGLWPNFIPFVNR